MKLKDILKRLRQLGFELLRQGGNHAIWGGHGITFPLPRHGEVKEHLGKNLLKKAEEAEAAAKKAAEKAAEGEAK